MSLSIKTHLQLLALVTCLDLCPSSKLMAFAKEIGHPRKGGGDGGKSLMENMCWWDSRARDREPTRVTQSVLGSSPLGKGTRGTKHGPRQSWQNGTFGKEAQTQHCTNTGIYSSHKSPQKRTET